ncbi:MAG TPA: hypothetical protein DCW51_07350 [Clostridium sp.]|nr:hypothetical protein [Clostridium sp.]
MSVNLSDLKEIDDFDKIRTFVKTLILTDETLYRLIFFSNSNPLDELSCVYPENPYQIFEQSSDTDNPHGVVLFNAKNDDILNYEVINILIDTESVRKSNSNEFNQTYIIIRCIAKGTNIRTLENGADRVKTILKLIDDNLNEANVNNLGKIRKKSTSDLSLNEENIGKVVMYDLTTFNSDWSSNKNFKKRIMHQ